MKIVKWGEWDDHFNEEYWKEHHHLCSYSNEEYAAVAQCCRELGYCFTGEYHQNGEYGVPYFEDGKPFMVSQRGWGQVMAEAWPEYITEWRSALPERQEKPYMDYVAFAWWSDEMKDKYSYPKGDK